MAKKAMGWKTPKGSRKVETSKPASKAPAKKVETKETKSKGYKGYKSKFAMNQDGQIKAKKPGWRIAENGNRYYEARPNRSDENRKKKPYLETGGGVGMKKSEKLSVRSAEYYNKFKETGDKKYLNISNRLAKSAGTYAEKNMATGGGVEEIAKRGWYKGFKFNIYSFGNEYKFKNGFLEDLFSNSELEKQNSFKSIEDAENFIEKQIDKRGYEKGGGVDDDFPRELQYSVEYFTTDGEHHYEEMALPEASEEAALTVLEDYRGLDIDRVVSIMRTDEDWDKKHKRGGGVGKMARGGYLEGREEYEGYKYLIWYRAPKGYSVSGDEAFTKKLFDNENVYFDSYEDAKEHAELSIRIMTEDYINDPPNEGMRRGGGVDDKKMVTGGGVESYRVESNQYIPQNSDKTTTYYYVVDSKNNTINKNTGEIYNGKLMFNYKFSNKQEAEKYAQKLNDKHTKGGGVDSNIDMAWSSTEKITSDIRRFIFASLEAAGEELARDVIDAIEQGIYFAKEDIYDFHQIEI